MTKVTLVELETPVVVSVEVPVESLKSVVPVTSSKTAEVESGPGSSCTLSSLPPSTLSLFPVWVGSSTKVVDRFPTPGTEGASDRRMVARRPPYSDYALKRRSRRRSL